MDTMDLKGIAWVGNIYQKFEAMCLEVEETMCQETAKYVENQVQTMGASMKRFYSDVMQDLLPPSSVDAVKIGAADLLQNPYADWLQNPYADWLLNPYADVGIIKKPKASIKEDTKELACIKGISGKDNDPPSPYADVGIYKKPKASIKEDTKKLACMKGISEKDNYALSKEPSSSKEVPGDQSTASPIRELNEKDETACDHIDMIPPQVSVECSDCNCGEGKEVKTCSCILNTDLHTDDASIGSPTSDAVLLVESSAKKGKKLRKTSLSKNLEEKSTGSCGDSLLVSEIGSCTSGDTQYGQSADGEVFVSHSGRPDDCNLDMIGKDDTNTRTTETYGQYSKWKLEETCVFVDGDDLCPVSQKAGKSRSYKKKIREAFSLKLKPARKQEYEQLAAQYGNVDCELPEPTLATNPNSKKSATPDFPVMEWELL